MKKTRRIELISIMSFLAVFVMLLVGNVNAAFSPVLTSPAQTETTVTLSWSKSNDLLFKNYEVTYSNNVNGPYSSVSTITDKSQTEMAVTNLQPSTTYYFIVKDTASEIISSSTAPSNTLQVSTAAIPLLSITSNTATTASLQWADYSTYTSYIPFKSYIVQMSTNGGSWSTVATITDASQNTYTVTGLSPANFAFRLDDHAGDSGQFGSSSNVEYLTIVKPIIMQINGDSTSCETNQQVQFMSSASGGTGSYTYQWFIDGATVGDETGATFNFKPTASGTYSITASARDNQASYLDVATSNTWTVTVANPTIIEVSGSSIIYVVAIIVAVIIVVVVVAALVIKRKKS